ncbi:sodium/calcium exchanger 1a isoform X2 [Xiphophorus couchianus]|uniref:sodium/calcium exchanger 1a isoform X2 n=1 Tax=Xiphophorus couchianus TaxID=32473 RepID=UPI001016BBFB|nr:sodium/calcium exchanger 1-like isoform X2 [Xiphophorus couchianus]
MSPAGRPSFLLLLFAAISAGFPCSAAGGAGLTPKSNSTARNQTKCGGGTDCIEGVILPVWKPKNPAFPDRLARATIYFVGLFYMFLGVSIIADRFMASIEVITSQERKITIKKPNGEKITTTVRVWNETVSNLTLMALGSSAPEILLSVVEVCGHNFDAGELGPNTIVGSAAFNMFVIIGLCVSVIPDGETRKVKHLRVFFVTATWSVFAYTWLYLILAVFSPGVVEIWEGLLTLFFFPFCVGFAYVADRRLLFYKYVYKRYRTGKQKGMIIETEGEPDLPSKVDVEMDGKMLNSHRDELLDGEAKELDEEEARRQLARILKELKQKHPEKETEQLMELANYQVLTQQQKSRAFYRCQATRIMTGAGNILKKHAADQVKRAAQHDICSEISVNNFSTKVFFDPGNYQCLENCGSVALNVVRRGGDLTSTVYVDYRTEDGTANAGSDYQLTEGTIVFKPGETDKEIHINIIDDDIFEEDEHFLVHLTNVRVTPDGANDHQANHADGLAGLGLPCTAIVTIFDDDHAGIFSFEEPVVTVSESVGVMEVKVTRNSGARGVVAVPYKTIQGTAKGGGEDFEDTHGVLEFDNDEIVKSIRINVVDDEQYEKNKNFFLEVGDPQLLEMSERKALLLQEVGGFVQTGRTAVGFSPGREIYRKVQGRDRPAPSNIVSITDGVCEEVLTKKEEEERRIAEMGRPTLGEHVRLEVIIEESYEFKNTVDKLIKKTNLALVIGTNSWREQFVEAITVSSGDDDDDCGEEKMPSCFDYVMHFLTVFWKLLFAFVPPTDYWNGWACFVVSISVIGMLTAIIGDLASHFGCTVGLKDSVTAVVFVALGTSVPDTFASKVAAIQDQYADASIGNVTGSNAVNVFLGIGLAWSIAAVYHYSKGQEFRVDPGTLAFSVTLFTIFAFICIAVLIYRRRPAIGGELGGPRVPKILTSCLFFSLWLMYIIFSSLEAYCHVKGF